VGFDVELDQPAKSGQAVQRIMKVEPGVLQRSPVTTSRAPR
jgi:hypothetical protein